MFFKFGQVRVASKDFHFKYQVSDIYSIDLSKITISDGFTCYNKKDTRYVIGYEAEVGRVIPLYIKTPKNCSSSGVRRYDENSPWKMGFNVSEDPIWMKQYEAIWERVEELIFEKLSGTTFGSGEYVNPKLITWDNDIKTRFDWGVPYGKMCDATGVLKIGSVYQQGLNYYLQVFLKECKYTDRESSFESRLSSDD